MGKSPEVLSRSQHRFATLSTMETTTFVIEAIVSEENSPATVEVLQAAIDRVKASVPDAVTTLTVTPAPEATEPSVTVTQI